MNVTDELEATATPYGAPIQIPASGGSFEFNGTLVNNTSQSVTADVWTVAKLPNGSETGALFLATVTLAPGEQLSADRTQYVPARAMAGDYQYIMRFGQYPTDAWAESSFPFTKLTDDDGSVWVGEWSCSGEPFSAWEESEIPSGFALLGCYPNPFNPETTIRFALPEASRVSLGIYDLSGRLVATLMNGFRTAGTHEVTFDASKLASGIYLYRLQAGEYVAAGKMVLMK